MKKYLLSLLALVAMVVPMNAQTELWNSSFTLESWFGDSNWGTETESTATLDNGVVTVKIAQNKDGQWKAQVKLHTGLTQLDANKQYDFTCKAVANQAVSGVTFKMMDNVEMKFENQSLKLNEGENTISEKNIDGKVDVSNGVIVFDFGYASAGTEITLSDFSLVEHDPVVVETTPWDATASNNLWAANLTPGSYWYAPGWAQIADPEMTVNGDRSFTLSFPSATTDQWQAQVHIPSGIKTSADATYDFQVVLNSTTDIAGATIKFVQVGDDNSFYTADRHKLKAGEDYVFQLENKDGINMDELKLVLDFGGNPENTVVTVKDIVVREHSDFTAEATEYGLVGDFNSWSGDENGVVFYTTEDANVLKATADSFTTGTWGFKVRKGTGWDNLFGRTDAMSTGEAAEIVAGGDNIYIGQKNYNTTLTNVVFTLGLDADGNATSLTVTADQNLNTADFVDSYMMVGAFQGWSFENNPLKFTYDKANGNYTASIDQIQGEFKIVKNNSWDGALAGVTGIAAGNTYTLIAGGNNAEFDGTIKNAQFTLTIGADGNATLAVEGENAETETTYGLVGEFNSWNNNDENYLLTKQEDGTYTIHVTDFPCGKSWKVSHNKSWKCFLGDGNDNTVTVGTPYTCAYGDNGNNLSINGEGTFTGTITLSDIVAETSATLTLTADAQTWTKTGYVMPTSSWGTDIFWTDACGQEVTVTGTEGSNVIEVSQDSYGYHNVITATINDDESLSSLVYNGEAMPTWGYFDFGSSFSQYAWADYYCYGNADKDNGYLLLYAYFDNTDAMYYVDIEWYDGAKEDAETWKGIVTGIKNVNAADNNAPVYNIAGQRVNNAQKGIFIINGKKVLK